MSALRLCVSESVHATKEGPVYASRVILHALLELLAGMDEGVEYEVMGDDHLEFTAEWLRNQHPPRGPVVSPVLDRIPGLDIVMDRGRFCLGEFSSHPAIGLYGPEDQHPLVIMGTLLPHALQGFASLTSYDVARRACFSLMRYTPTIWQRLLRMHEAYAWKPNYFNDVDFVVGDWRTEMYQPVPSYPSADYAVYGHELVGDTPSFVPDSPVLERAWSTWWENPT